MNLTEVCNALGVSRSGYHAHLSKSQRQRRMQDARLALEVREAFQASRCTYGSPRLVRCLRAQGLRHGKNRIARLMREQLLQVRQKRRFVPRTTLTDKASPVAPNHLLQRPAPTPTKSGSPRSPTCPLAKAGSTSPPRSTSTAAASSAGDLPALGGPVDDDLAEAAEGGIDGRGGGAKAESDLGDDVFLGLGAVINGLRGGGVAYGGGAGDVLE